MSVALDPSTRMGDNRGLLFILRFGLGDGGGRALQIHTRGIHLVESDLIILLALIPRVLRDETRGKQLLRAIAIRF